MVYHCCTRASSQPSKKSWKSTLLLHVSSSRDFSFATNVFRETIIEHFHPALMRELKDQDKLANVLLDAAR